MAALTAIAGREAMRTRCRDLGVDPRGGFELLGIDCLVDEDLAPWILECNRRMDAGVTLGVGPESTMHVEPAAGSGYRGVMPLVTRMFLKLALLYLVLALGAAVGLGLAGGGWRAALAPTWLHLFVVGWITQMIIGVALWMFPRMTREKPHGHAWLAWTCLVALNAGLVLRTLAEPALLLGAGSGLVGPALVTSAVLQWVGGMAFVVAIWPRIAPRKR